MYRGDNLFIADYHRNRFLAWADFRSVRVEYHNELNESLGSEDLDYSQNAIRLGIRNTPGSRLIYDVEIDGTLRNYTIAFEDSILRNIYSQAGLNLYLTLPVLNWMNLIGEDNFIFKSYREKSSLEPDYFWNFLRTGVVLNIVNTIDVTLGYEWELRKHRSISSDIFDVTEQNYTSNGIYMALSLLNSNGSYLSASISYQGRRFPQSATNDIISIYSDRNILSITAMAYWPLLSNLFLNTYIMYDNDKDKDLDQQSNQSTIFTAELEYKF